MLAHLRETLQYYTLCVRANMRAQMQYRFNFWFLVVGVFVFYFTQFLAIWLVMGRFQQVAGWSAPEVQMVFGFWVLAYGFAVFFFKTVRDFSYHVQMGILDPLFLRPRNLLVQLMASSNETAAIGHVALGITTVIVSAYRLSLAWSGAKVLFMVAAVLGGALIQAGIMLFAAALSFWTTNADRFFPTLYSMNRDYFVYPLAVHPRWLQVLGTAVFPFAFIGVMPVQSLLARTHGVWGVPWLGYATPLVGLAFFGLAYGLFSVGLKRYQGVGS